MKIFKKLLLSFLILLPFNLFAGPGPIPTQNHVNIMTTDKADEEVFAYYDLRDRKSYVQVTRSDSDEVSGPVNEGPLCIHIQIFQQDRNCDELDFEDQLTPNDTVVYDMDNLVRNDGTAVPINLDDDSYGFVSISSYTCGENTDGANDLIGNFRIVDDSGYEYRMNLITNRTPQPDLIPEIVPGEFEPVDTVTANLVIPFNTVDGANQADIVGFVVENDRLPNGQEGDDDLLNNYNEEAGITFSVFQFDENEEPISCDQKTFGCGPDVVLNYGINEDYVNSRGGPLLCEGGGLKSGQTNGYISLENPSFLSPLSVDDQFEFVCLVGLNNGNGTGSMDECQYRCVDEFGGDGPVAFDCVTGEVP